MAKHIHLHLHDAGTPEGARKAAQTRKSKGAPMRAGIGIGKVKKPLLGETYRPPKGGIKTAYGHTPKR